MTSDQNNPYDILGLDADATPDEINAAFKKKAKKAHPDQGGSDEDFMRVKQASMVLLDPVKRKRFDRDGTIEEDKPDNLMSTAMEKVASFFINSINATLNNPINFDQIDLIQGGLAYFDQHIDECQKQIKDSARQIKQFEKAMKRLKTKRKDDVIRTMLENHIRALKPATEMNKYQIKVLLAAKDILRDYEFEQEVSPQQMQISRIINPYGRQW